MTTLPKTNVYIDGFNFYYGLIKGTRHKWLDLSKLLQVTLPNNQIHQIKYYTALVNARPGDPNQPVRQQTYIRALNTIPNLSVYYGHFLTSTKSAVIAGSSPPTKVDIIKVEEKGSDVNLATHLLYDGCKGDYEVAVVISNDSDLLEPIRIVREELKLTVGVLNPQPNISYAIKPKVDFYRQLKRKQLQQCQFPDPMTDAKGTFHKPANW